MAIYYDQPKNMTDDEFIAYWNESYQGAAVINNQVGWLSKDGMLARCQNINKQVGGGSHMEFAIEYYQNSLVDNSKDDYMRCDEARLIESGWIRLSNCCYYYSPENATNVIINSIKHDWYKSTVVVSDKQYVWLEKNCPAYILSLNQHFKDCL